MALQRQLAKTMVLVTHDLAEACRLADRIGVLRGGRLLQIGTPDELAAYPADPYVRNLFQGAGG
jgi:osmoprotectant transport system ATP-binding protein